MGAHELDIPSFQPNRIFGTETEYNPVFIHRLQGGTRHTQEKSWKNVPRLPFPPGVKHIDDFGSNGGRFYMWNQIPEYSTPECSSPDDIVYCEESGEEFLRHAAALYVASDEDIIQVVMHKRTATDKYYESGFTVDPEFMDDLRSWGYHESYLVSRQVFTDSLYRDIKLAHLATRSILVGAGYLRPTTEDPCRVLPSQKLLDVEVLESSSTTKHKPLMNTRDEPHADAGLYAREHVIVGDANIAPWSTWVKIGGTSLVFRLAETGYGRTIKDKLPADMLQAAKDVAAKGPLARIALRNGFKVHAIDMQEIYVEALEELGELTLYPTQEQLVLAAMRRAIDDYRRDPRLLENRSEWIARSVWLEKVRDRMGDRKDLRQRINDADKLWDKQLPRDDDPRKQGIAFRKRQSMGFPSYNPAISAKYVTEAPPGTRAEERAALIRRPPVAAHGTYANWSRIDFEQKRAGSRHRRIQRDLLNPHGGNLKKAA